jgi:hypothetical protein
MIINLLKGSMFVFSPSFPPCMLPSSIQMAVVITDMYLTESDVFDVP